MIKVIFASLLCWRWVAQVLDKPRLLHRPCGKPDEQHTLDVGDRPNTLYDRQKQMYLDIAHEIAGTRQGRHWHCFDEVMSTKFAVMATCGTLTNGHKMYVRLRLSYAQGRGTESAEGTWALSAVW